MLDPQASRFWQAALSSGLMDLDGLTACWNGISPEKREAADHIDRRLARQAVQRNALTLWQAQQLLTGRTVGYKVDRYVLMELIGQGGMGRVYLARDTRLNRRVALKILSPERINNPRAIARFQREARVGAQLQHENLVRVYDFGESNGRFFLVMEYIEGKTIGTLIAEQGPMPSATAARLVRQVALGLEHAHRKGLIHRDVNPYNILVTHDGTAKLADLGLAIDLSEEERVTREGATVGTFDYVAPEQARHSHSADIRSDIYSLGCTLYHMIAGHVPFPSPSLPEKLFAHQALEAVPLNQAVPGLPEGLSEVVRRMMRKVPDERPATPMQVALALEPYVDELGGLGARGDAIRPGFERAGPPGEDAPASGRPPSHSPQPDDAQAVAAPRPAAALHRAGAAVGLGALSGTETGSGPSPSPEANAESPPGPLLTPIQDADEPGSEIPLIVDLGPEPPLSEGMSRSRPRFRLPSVFSGSSPTSETGSAAPDPSATATDTTAPGPWPAQIWLWWIAALSMLLLVVLLALMLARSMAQPPHADEDKTGPSRPTPTAEVVVRTEDGKETPFDDLLEAMKAAIGGRGFDVVELRNSRPMRLAADRAFDCSTGQGRLILRAAPGTAPVIEIERKSPGPFLATGSAVSLALSGLTILVRYPEPGATPAPAPGPVISAAGPAKLDHCAFMASGSSRLKGSRALVANGGVLDVDRCWFQGFDEAIEVIAFNGTLAQVGQTMFVPAPGLAPSRSHSPEMHGWGVRVRIQQGGAGARAKITGRRLLLDRCTVVGAGLLDLVDTTAKLPLRVEVKHCAVHAGALLALKPKTPGDSLTPQVQWLGEGNQLDILGPSWIVPSAGQETPVLSVPATDLASWTKLVDEETQPIGAKLQFLTDPANRSDSPRPQDFAIRAPSPSTPAAGADPELVGPWGR